MATLRVKELLTLKTWLWKTFWKIWTTFLQIVHTKLPKTFPKHLFWQKVLSEEYFVQQIYIYLTKICQKYHPLIYLRCHFFYQIIWMRLSGWGLPENLQKHNHLACLTEMKKILVMSFASICNWFISSSCSF